MPDLKPGEFEWEGVILSARFIRATDKNGLPLDFYPTYPSFPAALAAAQALYEESQKAPWVKLGERVRIRADGTEPQWYNGDRWCLDEESIFWVRAFRAGLAVKR